MRVIEFFAGIGLVGKGLESGGFEVVFANDICPVKESLYHANHGPERFVRRDIRDLEGSDLPSAHLATASFPCTDLSLAGRGKGLDGRQSGLFWQFVRLLGEMGDRRPASLLIENVPAWSSANGGHDFARSIRALNRLGYSCDPMLIDAARFVPQSRRRLFMAAFRPPWTPRLPWRSGPVRPPSLFAGPSGSFRRHSAPLPNLSARRSGLGDIVERFPPSADLWWNDDRLRRFTESLSPLHTERLTAMRRRPRTEWATAYRRTRNHRAVWEIRGDGVAGCLRTTRGGSSRQALVEAGAGEYRVRWMTAREYAALQGAPDLKFGEASDNQVRFGLGDAVCVPVVSWLARHYLRPVLFGAEVRSRRRTFEPPPGAAAPGPTQETV